MALTTLATPPLEAAELIALIRADDEPSMVDVTEEEEEGAEEISELTDSSPLLSILDSVDLAFGWGRWGAVLLPSAEFLNRRSACALRKRRLPEMALVGSKAAPQPSITRIRTKFLLIPNRSAMPCRTASARACWSLKYSTHPTEEMVTSTGTKTVQLPPEGLWPNAHVSQSVFDPPLHVPQSAWQSKQLPLSKYLLAAHVTQSVLPVPLQVRQEGSHAEQVPGLPPVSTYPSLHAVHWPTELPEQVVHPSAQALQAPDSSA